VEDGLVAVAGPVVAEAEALAALAEAEAEAVVPAGDGSNGEL